MIVLLLIPDQISILQDFLFIFKKKYKLIRKKVSILNFIRKESLKKHTLFIIDLFLKHLDFFGRHFLA